MSGSHRPGVEGYEIQHVDGHVERVSLDFLLHVWRVGFKSGCSSSLLTLQNAPGEACEAFADMFVSQFWDDPAAMETIRQQLRAFIENRNMGAVVLRVGGAQ